MRQHPDDCLSMAAIERYFHLLYWQKAAGPWTKETCWA